MSVAKKFAIGLWLATAAVFGLGAFGAFLTDPSSPPSAASSDVVWADEPISTCEVLPSTAAIEVFTKKQATDICQEVLRILDGPTVADLQSFEKASYLFSRQGYKKDYAAIASELVEIIRLRGLYDQRNRWIPTIDVVYKSYTAFNGIVSPQDVIALLGSTGPMAKTLSDDGLLDMIILMKRQRQRGN